MCDPITGNKGDPRGQSQGGWQRWEAGSGAAAAEMCHRCLGLEPRQALLWSVPKSQNLYRVEPRVTSADQKREHMATRPRGGDSQSWPRTGCVSWGRPPPPRGEATRSGPEPGGHRTRQRRLWILPGFRHPLLDQERTGQTSSFN